MARGSLASTLQRCFQLQQRRWAASFAADGRPETFLFMGPPGARSGPAVEQAPHKVAARRCGDCRRRGVQHKLRTMLGSTLEGRRPAMVWFEHRRRRRRRQCCLPPSPRVLSAIPLFGYLAGVGKGTYSTRVGEPAGGCSACCGWRLVTGQPSAVVDGRASPTGHVVSPAMPC